MNTPLTDALNRHIDEMPKTDADWTKWAAQYANLSRDLERRVQQLEADKAELVGALEIANNYLRDDLWTSGESRQSLRDANASLITKHKAQS